jgi:hypothetical protein
MSDSILSQLDRLNTEMEDISSVIEKSETFRKFGEWIQQRRVDSNIVCEINRYQDILSVDQEGTIIKADNLLQVRYVDGKKGKKKEK